tara:strand:+ start:3321 stop:4469 length:1149 start_codon:yes stop_codon:yes gene_type:complete
MFGIGVGTLALIVILSIFNGLEGLIAQLYSNFDTDIRIEAAEGKTFQWDDFPAMKVVQHEDVVNYSRSLEETVMFKYKDNHTFAILKGVDPEFETITGIDTMIWAGSATLSAEDGRQFLVPGYFVASQLGMLINNSTSPIQVYAPKKKKGYAINPQDAFYVENRFPSGVFAVNADFDSKYVLCAYEFAEDILHAQGAVTAVEIDLYDEADVLNVRDELQEVVGESYKVITREERNEIIFKTSQSEKWITFFILAFILMIATFNLLGSLTMLIIDKEDDIFTLRSMGAGPKHMFRIFHLEGQIIAWLGGFIGLLLGLLICWLQMQFGLIKIEGLIVDAYPVEIEWPDVVMIVITVIVIGYFASYFPAKFATRKAFQKKSYAAN